MARKAKRRIDDRDGTEISGWQLAVLFGVLTLVAVIPIITHPLPPISDYVNHLARMHVIAMQGQDANLDRFYEIKWEVIPNLMMDVVVPLLAPFVNIYLAGQLFTVAAFVLIMSGVQALHRALFGRWSIWPLIAFPLFYNLIYLTGLMNYLIGAGAALWGLTLWIRLRETVWPYRYIVSTLFVVVLFFCHLSALGVYGLGLLAFETQRLFANRNKPWRPQLLPYVTTAVPFLPVAWLMTLSPTWQLRDEFGWEPRGKIDGIVYAIQAYSDVVAFALAAVVTTTIVIAVRRGLLRVHIFGWFFALAAIVVYLAMPRTMFATYMADQRLPIAFLLILMACVRIDLRERLMQRGLIALLVFVIAVRVIEVDASWTDLSRETLSFKDSVRRITRGSTVLVASANAEGGDDVRDLGIVHAACIAMIERSSMVTRAFTVRGKQIMHVRPAYADRVDTEDGSPPSVEQLILAIERPDTQETAYWRDWPKNFDYVYVLFTDDESENPLPDILRQVYDGGRFRLYRVIKPAAAG